MRRTCRRSSLVGGERHWRSRGPDHGKVDLRATEPSHPHGHHHRGECPWVLARWANRRTATAAQSVSGISGTSREPLGIPVLSSETERVGFEPTEGCPSNDFESFAFDHSATSPRGNPGDTRPGLGWISGGPARARANLLSAPPGQQEAAGTAPLPARWRPESVPPPGPAAALAMPWTDPLPHAAFSRFQPQASP